MCSMSCFSDTFYSEAQVATKLLTASLITWTINTGQVSLAT